MSRAAVKKPKKAPAKKAPAVKKPKKAPVAAAAAKKKKVARKGPLSFRKAPVGGPPLTAPQAAPPPTAPATPNKQTGVTGIVGTVGSGHKRSPQKMANGGYAVLECIKEGHGECSLVPVYPSHFTAQMMAKDNYPQTCSKCHRLMKTGRKSDSDKDDNIVRIGGPIDAMMCQNALNHEDHKCVYCECPECYAMRFSAKTKRSLRSNRG